MEQNIYDIRWKEDEREWRACARRELAITLLHRFRPKQQNLSVLDLGCGTGMLVKQLQTFGTSYGMDLSERAVNYSRQRGLTSTIVASADRACFASDSFDVVTMIEVLEHVEDDMKALCDIRNILHERGMLILTVPAFQFLWSRRDNGLHHKRRYTAAELASKIARAGFRMRYSSYIDSFLLPPLWLLARLDRLRRNSKPIEMYEVSAPDLINTSLLNLCRLERALCMRLPLPFGVSVACVAERLD